LVNVDWKGEVHDAIIKALNYFESQGVRPTLRTVFYNLVSQNVIGNTKSTYKGLSRHLVQARQNGQVPWDALEDSARNVYGKFSDHRFDEDIIENNEGSLDRKLEEFNAENIINDFFDYVVDRASVSRWADQPQVAEIWIEKEALAKTVQSWTDFLGVKIRVNKGYSSWTFLYENCRELKAYLRGHEKVVVFYLGDLDPSGVDMERFLKEALEFFDLDPSLVELKRLSITADQVRRYNLPPRPDDAETIAKLARDPRTANYEGKFIVELDAMVAFVPEEFRKLIVKKSFGAYIKDIEVYKEEFMKYFKGVTPREFAEKQFKESMTAGVNSPNHTFWIIIKEDNNEEVGHLWFTIIKEKKVCLISDIFVYKQWRDQGIGTSTIHHLEKHIENSYPELDGLYLSVFNHNHKAKKLYERIGFKTTQESFGAINMIKTFER